MSKLGKNHSDRTIDKEAELEAIIDNYIDIRKAKEFTYCDLNGGAGSYDCNGRLANGSPITAHRTIVKVPDLAKFNGYIFEKNKVNFPLLESRLNRTCPDHHFRLYKRNSLKIDHRLLDQRRPMELIEEPLADGMFYFDPTGDIKPEAVIDYGKSQPNYMILCNLQRITILRQDKDPSITTVTEGLDRQWLISQPSTDRSGWTWLMGVPYGVNADTLAINISEVTAGPMFPLESKPGQECLTVVSERGFNAKSFIENRVEIAAVEWKAALGKK